MDEIKVSGNVCRPELRFTADGKSVFTFTVASQRKTKEGEEYTAWFKFLVTGDKAEAISQEVERIKADKHWITAYGSLMVDNKTGNVEVREYNGKQYANVTFYLYRVEEYQKRTAEDEVPF